MFRTDQFPRAQESAIARAFRTDQFPRALTARGQKLVQPGRFHAIIKEM